MAAATTTSSSSIDSKENSIVQSLERVARRIKNGQIKKISILAGAGISVSAGIPDFRSKGGFYETMDVTKYDLSREQMQQVLLDPTYLLTRELFDVTPIPYHQARRDFILSPLKYRPTLTHWFFRLLCENKLLKRFYSTNIDGLDVQTQYPAAQPSDSDQKEQQDRNQQPQQPYLVHVHGTLGTAACVKCGRTPDMDWYRNEILHERYPIRCTNADCINKTCAASVDGKQDNWIKPGTILYGESLPDLFFDVFNGGRDMHDVDLMIVAGSSMSVSPSCNIPAYVDKDRCFKIYVNRDIDELREKQFDLCLTQDCDEVFGRLIELLGWQQDYKDLVQKYGKPDENSNEENDKQKK